MLLILNPCHVDRILEENVLETRRMPLTLLNDIDCNQSFDAFTANCLHGVFMLKVNFIKYLKIFEDLKMRFEFCLVLAIVLTLNISMVRAVRGGYLETRTTRTRTRKKYDKKQSKRK